MCYTFLIRAKEREIQRNSGESEGSGGVVADPSVTPMTSLALPTGVILCHILTDFDVTQFQETLVL